MNETTAILFELRALAEQIEHLECQARMNGAGGADLRLTDLRSQTDELRQSMEQARRNRAASGYAVRNSGSPSDTEMNFSRRSHSAGMAAGIVARLGVRPDRMFEMLHAITPANR